MSRRRRDPLRTLTNDERTNLEQLGRATSAPDGVVARARALVAVADGASYTEAARRVGRRSGDAVADVVARFNREGLAAVGPRRGGGPRVKYGAPSGSASWRAADPASRAYRRPPCVIEYGMSVARVE
jgi:hypothetical protein